MRNQYEVSTLKKGLAILDLLMKHQSLSYAEILEMLKINKSTTYRLLMTLENQGFIVKNPETGRFEPSPKIAGSSANGTFGAEYAELRWLSVPPLIDLNEKSRETVYVGVLHGNEVVTVQVLEGKHSFRIHSHVGKRSALYNSAMGKCLLAFSPPSVQEEIIQKTDFKPHTPNTIVDKELFRQELNNIRQRGYAIDDEEKEIGLRCIAAPIFKGDRLLAAVTISGPTTRIAKSKDKYHIELVLRCSREISEWFDRY